MTHQFTEFWLALLEFGDSEEQRQKNWNDYCCWRFSPILEQLLEPDELARIRTKLDFPSGYSGDFEQRFNEFAAGHGGHAQPPTQRSFMDFSGRVLSEDASFAGRLLIGANFRETVFKGRRAEFNEAEFLGLTEFEGAEFCLMNSHHDHGVSFSEATFHGRAAFDRGKFPYLTSFDGVRFRNSVSFTEVEFWPRSAEQDDPQSCEAKFDQSQFQGSVNFWNAEFGNASFTEVEMLGSAIFQDAVFRGSADFNNAKFRGTTSFGHAAFWMPPKFFETELHEDVTFAGANWEKAEESYWRSCRGKDSKAMVKYDADRAMRAWDRLALIMSQREKLPERHEFFRLKMRAQRQRDGRSLLSFLNWLFDVLSDYGWGVGRALTCWAVQFVAMGLVLAVMALNCFPSSIGGLKHAFRVVLDAQFLSFANSHAFLRLASSGGWLHESRNAILNSCEADRLFNYSGLAQAVIGPILLFLVLLTLRNRFRLG